MKFQSKAYQTFILPPLLFGLISIFSGCSFFNKEEGEKPLARVKDKYLLKEDVANLLGDYVSKEDSATLVSNYIQTWINEMLLLNKAELNLKEEQKDFSKQLENYRNSLLIYAYEKKIIQQKLDTAVTLSEIEDYYLTNQQNFVLKEDVFKVIYARFGKDAPQLTKIRSVYPSSRAGDLADFIDLCHQFSMNFYDDDKWIIWEDLVKYVPLKSSDPANFLKRNKHFELQDSLSYYFTKVVDFKNKGSISPLSFEKERIKNIIINQRKLSLLKQMKLDLYNNAMAKKDFEIYD